MTGDTPSPTVSPAFAKPTFAFDSSRHLKIWGYREAAACASRSLDAAMRKLAKNVMGEVTRILRTGDGRRDRCSVRTVCGVMCQARIVATRRWTTTNLLLRSVLCDLIPDFNLGLLK